jgi:hypothetical protein
MIRKRANHVSVQRQYLILKIPFSKACSLLRQSFNHLIKTDEKRFQTNAHPGLAKLNYVHM